MQQGSTVYDDRREDTLTGSYAVMASQSGDLASYRARGLACSEGPDQADPREVIAAGGAWLVDSWLPVTGSKTLSRLLSACLWSIEGTPTLCGVSKEHPQSSFPPSHQIEVYRSCSLCPNRPPVAVHDRVFSWPSAQLPFPGHRTSHHPCSESKSCTGQLHHLSLTLDPRSWHPPQLSHARNS